MRTIYSALVLSATLALAGCSALDWMVYKIDIPQGNFLDSKQVEQLRVKMTKEQVRFVMGPPMLVDAFDSNHWYYIYSYQNGNGPLERKELVISFVDNRLATLKGDFSPSEHFNQPLQG
jgi:outer membrane protein assembly factor BamE